MILAALQSQHYHRHHYAVFIVSSSSSLSSSLGQREFFFLFVVAMAKTTKLLTDEDQELAELAWPKSVWAESRSWPKLQARVAVTAAASVAAAATASASAAAAVGVGQAGLGTAKISSRGILTQPLTPTSTPAVRSKDEHLSVFARPGMCECVCVCVWRSWPLSARVPRCSLCIRFGMFALPLPLPLLRLASAPCCARWNFSENRRST